MLQMWKVGHFRRDPECPAKGKIAISVEELTILVKKTKERKTKKSVMYVRSERDEDEYAFTVTFTPPEKIDVTVGGVVVVMVIDSGASTNVIDKNLWLKLKQDKIDRQICIVTSNETIMSDYKKIFEGMGKLKVLWKGVIRKQKKKP